MNIKKHIPNLFTLGNLFCGTLAVMYAVLRDFEMAALLVVAGIILDFFDGFIARILKVQGELGKQLDSLADMVTSGVVPGVVMFAMLNPYDLIHFTKLFSDVTTTFVSDLEIEGFTFDISLLAFLLTLSAGYRLAKFNIDTRQSDSFIGLPTPAMSLFVVSLPLIVDDSLIDVRDLLQNQYVLLGITVVLSFLMNANLPLLSLKFKSFGFKENLMKYLLILISVVMIVTLKYLAVPLIIIVYILLSIIDNLTKRKQEA
jgi:CDP-diacylglycerol--serine O-phosphatidyltransferase